MPTVHSQERKHGTAESICSMWQSNVRKPRNDTDHASAEIMSSWNASSFGQRAAFAAPDKFAFYSLDDDDNNNNDDDDDDDDDDDVLQTNPGKVSIFARNPLC